MHGIRPRRSKCRYCSQIAALRFITIAGLLAAVLIYDTIDSILNWKYGTRHGSPPGPSGRGGASGFVHYSQAQLNYYSEGGDDSNSEADLDPTEETTSKQCGSEGSDDDESCWDTDDESDRGRTRSADTTRSPVA